MKVLKLTLWLTYRVKCSSLLLGQMTALLKYITLGWLGKIPVGVAPDPGQSKSDYSFNPGG